MNDVRSRVKGLPIEIDSWPSVTLEALEPAARESFRKLERAMRAAAQRDKPITKVLADHQLSKSYFYYLLERCRSLHPDGKVWGFRALIPHSAVKEYSRSEPISGARPSAHGGDAGAFRHLLNKYPELMTFTIQNLFGRSSDGQPVLTEPVAQFHRTKFLKKCREIGIDGRSYPLNRRNGGLRSLTALVTEAIRGRGLLGMEMLYGKEAANRMRRTQRGGAPLRPNRPYQNVELDGMWLPVDLKVRLFTPHGSVRVLKLEGVWIIAIVDVDARAALGYAVCPFENYAAQDVLEAFYAMLTGVVEGERIELPDTNYPGKSLPAALNPALSYRGINIVSFDNTMAQRCEKVISKLVEVLGCVVVLGPAAVPEYRAYVESEFGMLRRSFFNRLARSGPIDFDRILTAIDAIFWQFNATQVISGRVPMDALLESEADPFVRLIPDGPRSAERLLSFAMKKTIRGNLQKGVLPYIQFENATYGSTPLTVLGKSGKNLQIYIEVNPVNVQYVRAFLDDGRELGLLRAHGRWSHSPHSLRMRKQIVALENAGKLKVPEGRDVVAAFHDYVAREAGSPSRRARAVIAETRIRGAVPKPRPALAKALKKQADLVFDIPANRRAGRL